MKERDDRIAWISGRVTRNKKGSDTVLEGMRIKQRNYSRKYTFIVNTNDVTVCKEMFLCTLGYKYDTIITKMFEAMTPRKIKPPAEKRGKHKPNHAMTDEDLDAINTHIESFGPTISHYRRAHAPLRRYLPPELTVKLMYGYFKESYQNIKCSVDTYRRRVKKKNISFSKLGEEECEVCQANIVHQCKANDWVLYIKRAKTSRGEYRKDADIYPPEKIYFVSADMQKIIMLPHLPGVKTAVFTRRITMYHETFAPLIPSKEVKKQWKKDKKRLRKLKPVGMIWHEGIQGRCDEDVGSSVVKFLRHPDYRNAEQIVIWADNCVGQLKNWTMFSAMVYEVNNYYSNVSKVSIKYFEKGHTVMSADSYHHQVEKAMKCKKRLYNFDDFEDCLSICGTPVVMEN